MADENNGLSSFFEEANELLQMDISTFPEEDQLLLALYFTQFIKQIKPICVKNMAKDPKQTFLFKM